MKPGHMQLLLLRSAFFFLLREIHSVRMSTSEFGSWLSFVVSSVSLSLSHWYPGSGVVLDCIDS